jgi:hypothetical protein
LRNAVVFTSLPFQHSIFANCQPQPALFEQSPKLHAIAPFHFKNQAVSFHSSLTLALCPGRQKQRHPAFHVGAVGTLRMPSSAPPSLRSLAARNACLRQACEVYPSEGGLVNLQPLSTKPFFSCFFAINTLILLS